MRGKFDEGIPYLRRAIDRTLSPPGWYFHLIAVHDYLEGDYAAMLTDAERSGVDGSAISLSFIAIAQGALGQKEAARETLDRLAARSPAFMRDPVAAYRTHHPTEAASGGSHDRTPRRRVDATSASARTLNGLRPDASGAQLDGASGNYVLRFEPGNLPPVDAFWSITVYNLAKRLMVANPIDRYWIGDRTKGLVYGKDGALEIYLQAEDPGGEKSANWLPAPAEPFYLG